MFFKKMILSLLCMLCASALLAGCGAVADTTSSPPALSGQSSASETAEDEASVDTALQQELTAPETAAGEPSAAGSTAAPAQSAASQKQSAASAADSSSTASPQQSVESSTQQSSESCTQPNIGVWVQQNGCGSSSTGQTSSGKPTFPGSQSASSSNPSSSSGSQASADQQQQEVLRLVNEERAKAGLAACSYRADLQAAADLRAREIVESFSHTRPDGRSCFTVFDDLGLRGFTRMGENIAYGYPTPAAVMQGWMNSAGHRENILNSGFTGLVVGVYNGRWVQLFVA